MRSLSLHAQAAGDTWLKAGAKLATAVEMYRDMAMTFWLRQAETALAQMEG